MAVAASTFTGVDLSTVPFPGVVETLDYETVLANWLATFQSFCTAAGIDYTAILDSDPAYKVLQAGAYQEIVLRQRVNDAAKAVMVAYAQDTDLDNLAALVDVERFILTPADPTAGIVEVDESDTALRQRTVLAPQGYSVAGPEGAYVFFAKSADATIQDVSVDTPSAGNVLVTVLGNAASGIPTSGALANVTAKLNTTSIRPLTDNVTVQAATILNYALAANITLLPGYDQTTILANATAGVVAYQAACFALGAAHTLAGLSAAMFVAGVKNIAITSPTADVVPTLEQAAICTGNTLTYVGTEFLMASQPPSLLPPNATPLETALAQTIAAQIGAIPVPLRDLWNPATCPLNLLPWLAWTVGVESWDSTWPEYVKRGRIASAIAIHRYAGSMQAVYDVINAYGGGTQLTLWYEMTPPGPPFTFTLSIVLTSVSGIAPTADFIDSLIADVTLAKGARDTFTFEVAINAIGAIGLFAAARPATYARLECAAVNA